MQLEYIYTRLLEFFCGNFLLEFLFHHRGAIFFVINKRKVYIYNSLAWIQPVPPCSVLSSGRKKKRYPLKKEKAGVKNRETKRHNSTLNFL